VAFTRPRKEASVRAFKLTEKVCWAECLEILIEGELDMATAGQLRDALDETVGSGPVYVVIDLQRCEFLDATALSAMVDAQRRLADNGQELLVYAAGGQAERLLTVTAALDRRCVFAEAEEGMHAHGNGYRRNVVGNPA
jgi:anti-anti-sigma factor